MKAQDFVDNYHLVIQYMYKYHSMFYKLAAVGEPCITTSIPTAAIAFDRDGKYLQFLFNPDFLEGLSWDEICMVCCHEMEHILMKHGIRAKDERLNRDIANRAMDICVNEDLVRSFGFKRSQLPNLTDDLGIIFKDTVFDDNGIEGISNGETFEYYYNKIAENSEKQEVMTVGNLLDDHSQMGDMTDQDIEDMLSAAVGDDPDMLENIKNAQQALQAGKGSIRNVLDQIINVPPKKKKWETLAAGIRTSILRQQSNVSDYQWVKPSRRLFTLPKSFMLPSIGKTTREIKKIDLWLFQDISGSCASYAETFLKASLSIPTDVFNIKFFVFDTRATEVPLDTKQVFYGGGTCFQCIQETVERAKRHPDLVWIITDGYGTHTTPKHPDRWGWFLTPNNTKACIPPKSKTFNLKDYYGF